MCISCVKEEGRDTATKHSYMYAEHGLHVHVVYLMDNIIEQELLYMYMKSD